MAPLPWEPQATLNPGAPRGALGESGPKKGKSQNACWGAGGPQEFDGFRMVEDAPGDISRDPRGSWPRAAPPGANASEALVDQFGGSGLESVQALWGSTLAHPPLFPFQITNVSLRPQTPLESRPRRGSQGGGPDLKNAACRPAP